MNSWNDHRSFVANNRDSSRYSAHRNERPSRFAVQNIIMANAFRGHSVGQRGECEIIAFNRCSCIGYRKCELRGRPVMKILVHCKQNLHLLLTRNATSCLAHFVLQNWPILLFSSSCCSSSTTANLLHTNLNALQFLFSRTTLWILLLDKQMSLPRIAIAGRVDCKKNINEIKMKANR